jgi:hypothetical protein
MYTVYYLLFNTIYIKNSAKCFEPCHSSSSGTQLFITPVIYVRYSLKYISWVDKMPLTPKLNTAEFYQTNLYILMSTVRR